MKDKSRHDNALAKCYNRIDLRNGGTNQMSYIMLSITYSVKHLPLYYFICTQYAIYPNSHAYHFSCTVFVVTTSLLKTKQTMQTTFSCLHVFVRDC